MKLLKFNGGLNVRQAPELISPVEALHCVNVDMSSEQLSSSKGLGASQILGLTPYYFEPEKKWFNNADTRDYLDYQGKLYWTDGNKAQKYSLGVTNDLGIEQPSSISSSISSSLTAPTLSGTVREFAGTINTTSIGGDFPAGDITYYLIITFDSKVCYVTTKIVTAVSLDGFTVLSTGLNIPTGATVTLGRDYLGTIYEVPTTDSTYDISSNPILTTTIDASKILPITTYKFTCAIKEGSRLSDLSTEVSLTLNNNGWFEITSLSPLSLGQSFVYFLDGKEVTDTIIVYNPILGSDWSNLGISGFISYVYTYYNASDGTESQPSPVSTELEVSHGELSVNLVASIDPQVTNIFLYRIGDSLTGFTKVIELPNISTTYLDTLEDSAILGGLLTSTLNGKAPIGLKYLTQAYGVFFGAVGNKLYFTRDIGNPNYWPETYYIDFHIDITGLAVTTNGLIVFTYYETYLITGTNSSTFVKYLLDSSQGCISNKSIVQKSGTVLFLSTDGLCAINGSTIEVVSKFKLGKQLLEPVNAILYDEAYYCQLVDKSIFTFDLRYTASFKYYDFSTDWLVVANDTLYALKDTIAYEMFSGSQVTYSYSTGNITEGSISELKSYNDIYIYAEGSHTIKVYIDNQYVSTSNFEGEFKPLKISVPQEYQRGSSIRFELTGIGTIKEIEYKAIGRTNGR